MNKINDSIKKQIEVLQTKIKYVFKDKDILIRALTHSSYANEYKKMNLKYNERLEFLGDSVLGLVVSDYIFTKYENYPEGELTKLRATVVCETVLSEAAIGLGLGQFLLLGKGEEATGGRDRVSILADAFEALIAAIYLDGGFSSAREFVLINLSQSINRAVNGNLFLDYKTELQEILQRKTRNRIEYHVVREEGPDHNKIFYVEVKVGNEVLGHGTGRSKKEAEQNAAKLALSETEIMNE